MTHATLIFFWVGVVSFIVGFISGFAANPPEDYRDIYREDIEAWPWPNEEERKS